MLFNSLHFLAFFPLVTGLYFVLPYRLRPRFLLLASIYFYCVFIPVYVLILAFTIVVDYTAGVLIESASRRRRALLLIMSICANVGVLAVFKYVDFCFANLSAAAGLFHWQVQLPHLGVALPLGLSFHTFQAMSYTIEVYRGRYPAERDFGTFALYVMFYPQLVAGPIERPQHLLPQLHASHDFDYRRVTDGLRRMLWGFFKKVVVADRLAVLVDAVYKAPARHGAPALLLASYFFAFQIYCDFSGYSDIAIGTAQVMGIRLMENFARPYFAQSVGEFWHRWHISLSTWFRDYVYIPLGGNRVSRAWRYGNLMVVFVLSGLWHGANWTYVIWGTYHGIALIAADTLRRLRERYWGPLPHKPLGVVGATKTMITFATVCVGWILFRANNLSDAALIIARLTSASFWVQTIHVWPQSFGASSILTALAAILLVVAFEHLNARESVVEGFRRAPVWMRWSLYYATVLLILLFGQFGSRQFIYFQF